jgi:hypothetical protein
LHRLADTAPELRMQCIDNGIERIDAVIITHAHAEEIVTTVREVFGKPVPGGVLVIALADADGGYRRALVDHALIPRPESPVLADVLQDDPASVIRIADNRAFSITLHSWASAGTWYTSNRTYTFRRQDGCFRLIGFDQSSLHRASGETEETSINYLTGRAWTRSGSIEDDEGDRQSRRLAKRSMICLEDVGDGFSFQSGLTVD